MARRRIAKKKAATDPARPPRHGALAGYPKDTDGWPLCRFCGSRCPTQRHTFCSPACVHEWKIRSSASYARDAVCQRDHGICAKCGVNTDAQRAYLNQLRLRLIRGTKESGVRQALADWTEESKRLRELGYNTPTNYGSPAQSGQFWQADHVRAVKDGGGLSGLDNLQTLCTPCHKQKSAAAAGKGKKV